MGVSPRPAMRACFPSFLQLKTFQKSKSAAFFLFFAIFSTKLLLISKYPITFAAQLREKLQFSFRCKQKSEIKPTKLLFCTNILRQLSRLEHLTVNQRVLGSSPRRRAKEVHREMSLFCFNLTELSFTQIFAHLKRCKYLCKTYSLSTNSHERKDYRPYRMLVFKHRDTIGKKFSTDFGERDIGILPSR